MGVRLEQRAGTRAGIEPGQYVDEAGIAHICCPACGGIEALSPDHVVAHDGKVVPAWKCPTATCSFWEFVELARSAA